MNTHQPLIIFRTDSSTSIGSGHVMRCLTLAKVLKRKADIHFVCRNLPNNLSEFIQKQDFKCHLFSRGDDSLATIEYIKTLESKPDWLILDHYELGEEWETRVRSSLTRLLVVEDMPTRHHICDTILIQNALKGDESVYNNLVPPQCEKLIGPKYALLRKDFKIWRERHQFLDKPKTLLVFFGSTDPTSETLKTLRSLQSIKNLFTHINVVLGAQCSDIEKVKQSVSNYPNIRLHIQTDKIAELMAESDLALGAGGFSCFERFCIGLPTLAVAVASNQIRVLERFHKEGLLLYLGESSNITEEDISLHLREAPKNWHKLGEMAEKALTLVDGEGTQRVVDSLMGRGEK